MKRAVTVKIVVIMVLSVILLALLQRLPKDGKQISVVGKNLLENIHRDRPAKVGDADAEYLLRNVERKPAVSEKGLIELDDDTFSPGYDEIYDHREIYYGRKIVLHGYAVTDDLPEGQFLVGRDLVWCCESDKYFIGFLVLTDGVLPISGANLRVGGTLESVVYTEPESGKMFEVPAIRAERIDGVSDFSRSVFPF